MRLIIYGLSNPGNIIHNRNRRIGNDKKTSALNKWSQAHDCKNPVLRRWVSVCISGRQRSFWTILALSMRASEYIIDEMKKQNL